MTLPRTPPAGTLRAELHRRWARVRDGEEIDVTVLLLDLCGSSQLTNVLEVTDAHALKERFRSLVDVVADRWGGFPLHDYAGDATALFFWRPTHAIAAALDVLIGTSKFRRSLSEAVRRRLGLSGARGFRLSAAHGPVAFDRRPGRSTGAVLDLAGHVLKKCPAPGFLITQGLCEEGLLADDRRLFAPGGPVVHHLDRRIHTAVCRPGPRVNGSPPHRRRRPAAQKLRRTK